MKPIQIVLGAAILAGLVWLMLAISFDPNSEPQRKSVLANAGIPSKYPSSTVQPASTSEPAFDDTHVTMITGTTDIPIYPSALNLTRIAGTHEKPGASEYEYVVRSSVPAIVSLYLRILAAHGWTVVTPNATNNPDAMSNWEFIWRGPMNGTPTRRLLELSIGGSTYISSVWLSFEIWPDPQYVPLYPDAQNAQAAWEHDAEYGVDQLERVVTYKTAASPSEVEAYYKDALLQYGWERETWASSPLRFTYQHPIPCPSHPGDMETCHSDSNIEITVSSEDNGMIAVRLQETGDEVRDMFDGK